jgi:hypothetical protein
MTSDFTVQLFQKLFLALLSSTIPIAFANFMVWKRKVPPSLFVKFTHCKMWMRDPLVILVVMMQFVFALMRDTQDLFEPKLRLGAILLTIILSGAGLTLAMIWMYVNAREALVKGRASRDKEDSGD